MVNAAPTPLARGHMLKCRLGRWRSSTAEQWFCKPQVGGSIPLASSIPFSLVMADAPPSHILRPLRLIQRHTIDLGLKDVSLISNLGVQDYSCFQIEDPRKWPLN